MSVISDGVQTAFKRMLDGTYQYLQYPAVLRATVTAMSKIGDRTWLYSVKPLRPNPNGAQLPEIPGIKSHVEVEAGVGGMVAVALLDGKTARLVIVDEVIP